ncbi:uncharacterized protein [Dermacentor andersoni]|uniref:uncharacterized protein n=1 Tax=Dermacentor andersoni TaxID=34620 RepID=UPI0021552539|nr:uncharacterized protein LOC126516576 [Dermacentor andersoni]
MRIPIGGHRFYSDSNYPEVAALARKDLTITVAIALGVEIHHQILTIWPVKKDRPKCLITNVYSPPRDKRADFSLILSHVSTLLSTKDRLIFLGDFNAWHSAWGYQRDTAKGFNLLRETQSHELVLITQPGTPTRIGNSVARDTTPDLTFVNNETGVTWCNLDETLGSDHYLLCVNVNTAKVRQPLGVARLTDWKRYREQQQAASSFPATAAGWTTFLKEAHAATTREIKTTTEAPAVDSHLAHLWEAHRSLTKRWKRQRRNRKLRRRIALLANEANTYAKELNNQNWRSFCDSLRGTLSPKKTWAILRCMLDPTSTRTETSNVMRRLLGEYKGSEQELLEHLKRTYTGAAQTSSHVMREYQGQDNSSLDAPITFSELYAAAQTFKKNTAPGPDQITNAMRRNLIDVALQHLVDFFN